MGEISLEVNTINKFISSLSKSIQALCHGCMDFNNSIEIIGYVNINIDSNDIIDCVLNEKVRKSTANSMTCVSNSFHAKKDKPKQTKDSSCSPIRQNEHFSKVSANHKRQNDCKGDFTHGGTVRKRSKCYSSSQYYLTSEGSSTGNEHNDGVSDFSYPEQFIKSETLESGASDLEPFVASTSQDISVKKETDITLSEAFSESQDNQSTKSGNFENIVDESLGESSHVDSENQPQDEFDETLNFDQKSIEQFDADVNRVESSHSYPTLQDAHDTETFYRQQSDQNQIESNEDAQFDVIEIGDDDDEMQGLFQHTGQSTSRQYSRRIHPESPQRRHDYQAATLKPSTSTVLGPSASTVLGPYSASTVLGPSVSTAFGCLTCALCESQFVFQSQLTQHMLKSHRDCLFFCHLCDKHFTSRSGLKHHLEAHKGRQFICHVCDFKFKHKHHLKSHLKKIHKLAKCNSCYNCFSLGDEYTSHVLHCF